MSKLGKRFFQWSWSVEYVLSWEQMSIDIFLGIFKKKQSSESSTEFVLHLSILSWEAWQILLGVFRLASLFWPRAGDGVSSTSSSWTLCFRLSDGKSCWCDETFLEKNITCYMMLHVPFSSHCDVYRGVSFQHNGWTATFLALAVYTIVVPFPSAMFGCYVWTYTGIMGNWPPSAIEKCHFWVPYFRVGWAAFFGCDAEPEPMVAYVGMAWHGRRQSGSNNFLATKGAVPKCLV